MTQGSQRQTMGGENRQRSGWHLPRRATTICFMKLALIVMVALSGCAMTFQERPPKNPAAPTHCTEASPLPVIGSMRLAMARRYPCTNGGPGWIG